MNDAGLQFYLGFIPQIWRFYVSWYIPGTYMTPAEFSLTLLAFSLVIRYIKRFVFSSDVSFGSSNPGSKSSEG